MEAHAPAASAAQTSNISEKLLQNVWVISNLLLGVEPGGRVATQIPVTFAGGCMLEPKQRVTVDLSGLTIQGVSFSQNVQKAIGSVVEQVSTDPPTYKVELLFSFKGVKRVEVPESRIHPA